ncbi:LemA family protein [Mycoplasma procyoni]|uniref:LemA family protein n=1 Tax=Mycoplasma procyoni TaxID=568784 RepID=UPI00197B6FB0|nr:LemA family protein [Mycoplasma procyoni]MBN3535025.1 LemA family protein [Mycoplasma procyoni]
MSNLFDQRNNDDQQGFEARVDNSVKKATASTAAKVVFWIFGTLLLFFGWIYYIVKRNKLNRMQNGVNQAASTIDTQLAKRADTLVKLVDQVKSYKEFEKSLLVDVTRMRSLAHSSNGSAEERVELDEISTRVSRQINVAFEAYPDLKASSLYDTLMKESIYLEEELSAARRLYNSKVTEFNEQLFVWPANVVASGMKLSSLPLFKASAVQRADVSMKGL